MKKKSLTSILLLIGFISVIGQTLLMREFIVVFQGNELTLGLILGNWLLLTALGSYAGGLFSEKYDLKARDFAVLQVIAAITLPAQIFLARITRNILGIDQGEILGLWQILSSTFMIMAPLCIVLGFQFTLGCRIYSRERNLKNIGKVYFLESTGSLIGGLLFSYLLIEYLNPFQTAFIIAILALTAAIQLLEKTDRRRLMVYFALAASVLCFMNASNLEDQSHSLQWGADFISSENSIHGNIAVVERNKQYSVYENGLLMYSTDDVETNEEIHFTMLEHPNPRKVLLVGGGTGGALEEILKHPIEEVVYVELDPTIIWVSRRHLKEENLVALEDPRVREVFTDGRLFIKEVKDRYDVIVVNLPEPSTAQLNRFYTQEFFQEVSNALNDEGIISIGIPSSESYIGEERRILGGSIYKTMKAVFSEAIAIPGEKNILLASKKTGLLTYDPKTLNNRMNDRGIETTFLHESYVEHRLSEEKIEYTLNSLESGETFINTDFRPVGYYYYLLLWSSLTGEGITTSFMWMVFIASTLILLMLLRRTGNPAIPLATIVIGLSGMVYEVITLLAFQALYGYVYHKIALIIAAFMAGLALGAFSMNRMIDRGNKRIFEVIMSSMAAYMLILPLLLKSTIFRADTIFTFLVTVAGLLVGLEFPLASKLYHVEKRDIGETAGVVYASDLIGAFFGAIISSAILVPLVGITNLCIIVAGLNIIVLMIVLTW